MIKASEGCRLTAYKDTGGVLTIGYGHTGPDVHSGMSITQDVADGLLKLDMKKAGDAVLRLTNKVTQGQLDALTSFVFNLGAGQLEHSTLLRFHNQGRYDLAAGQFSRWVHDNGKVLPGLVKRRAKEKALYCA